MNFYKHHLGDYAKDTGDLDTLEHGIYRLLLDHYYATEKPLPDDLNRLACIARVRHSSHFQKVQAISNRFFPVAEDGLRHHSRCDKEIHLTRESSKQNSENAKKRWEEEKSKENKEPLMPVACEPHANGNAIPDSKTPLSTIKNSSPNGEVLKIASSTAPNGSDSTLIGQATEIVDFMNRKLKTRYRSADKKGRPTASTKMVMDRLRSGYSLEDLESVIATKAAEWLGNDKMQQFLRPSTLFRASNFDNYYGQIGSILNGGPVHG